MRKGYYNTVEAKRSESLFSLVADRCASGGFVNYSLYLQ